MSVSKRLRYEVLRRDNHACKYCGAAAPDAVLNVDHVTPTALGGSDDPGNLVAACKDCNSGKSASNPDAPLVADVAQDALRWAQAQQVAAQQMMDRLNEREAHCAAFEDEWNRWTFGRDSETAPLPANWKQSVVNFLSVGLPLPLLCDCIDLAMAVPNIKVENLFRYTCGIAWNKVAELRNSTKAIIHGSPMPSVSAGLTGANVISDLIGMFGFEEDEWKERVQRELHSARDDEDGPLDPELLAIRSVVWEVIERGYQYENALHEIFECLPLERRERVESRALLELREMLGEDFTEHDLRANAAAFLAREFEVEYLNSLPGGEQDEWLLCGAEYVGGNGSEQSVIEHAARHARMNRTGRGGLHGMCHHTGNFGAMCPTRAKWRAWLDDCAICSEKGPAECRGHDAFCENHLGAAIDGRVHDPVTGRPLVVRDYSTIPDPWAVKP